MNLEISNTIFTVTNNKTGTQTGKITRFMTAEVTAYTELVKACSLMASMTDLNEILDVRVWPW